MRRKERLAYEERMLVKWRPLIFHVLRSCFSWVLIQEDNNISMRKIRRSVGMDDLEQEGYIALIAAIRHFDNKHPSDASFKTYAYNTIRNQFIGYLSQNLSVLKTGHYSNVKKFGSTSLQEDLRAATSYMTFSELEDSLPEDQSRLELCPIYTAGGTELPDPSEVMEEVEFQKHCLDKLKARLDTESYRILTLRFFEGMTLKEVSEKVGMSPEGVRNALEALNYKVHDILYTEVRDHGFPKDREKSLAHQTRKT